MNADAQFWIRMLLYLSLVANMLFIAAGSDSERKIKLLTEENKKLKEKVWSFYNVKNDGSIDEDGRREINERIGSKIYKKALIALHKISLL